MTAGARAAPVPHSRPATRLRYVHSHPGAKDHYRPSLRQRKLKSASLSDLHQDPALCHGHHTLPSPAGVHAGPLGLNAALTFTHQLCDLGQGTSPLGSVTCSSRTEDHSAQPLWTVAVSGPVNKSAHPRVRLVVDTRHGNGWMGA